MSYVLLAILSTLLQFSKIYHQRNKSETLIKNANLYKQRNIVRMALF